MIGEGEDESLSQSVPMDQVSESQISGQDSAEEYKHEVIVIETDSATDEEEEEQEETAQVSVCVLVWAAPETAGGIKQSWSVQYGDDDAENEEDDEEDGDGGMAEGAEESNEGSGSGDGNEAYEGDEAEVTEGIPFFLLWFLISFC